MEIREIFSTPRGWLIIDEEEARWQGAVDFFFPSSFSRAEHTGQVYRMVQKRDDLIGPMAASLPCWDLHPL